MVRQSLSRGKENEGLKEENESLRRQLGCPSEVRHHFEPECRCKGTAKMHETLSNSENVINNGLGSKHLPLKVLLIIFQFALPLYYILDSTLINGATWP